MYAFIPKSPLDTTPYPRDSRSQALPSSLPDGSYIYVRDVRGIIYILPDGPHMHPHVLGAAAPATYAGDFTIEQRTVVDVTNLSGTFQFDDPDGLREVAAEMQRAGLTVASGAVRLFPSDGSPPVVLS
jgi:hypothetical protein